MSCLIKKKTWSYSLPALWLKANLHHKNRDCRNLCFLTDHWNVTNEIRQQNKSIALAAFEKNLYKYFKLPELLYQAKELTSSASCEKAKFFFCFILLVRLQVASEILIRKVILLILRPSSLFKRFHFEL